MTDESLLSVADLNVAYKTSGADVHAVDDVSFTVEDQQIVGLLGESGCGKSTLSKSLVRWLDSNAVINAGEVMLDGEDVLQMDDNELRDIRWKRIAYIPQNAMGSLDPVVQIGKQLIEPVVKHRSASKQEARSRAKEVLNTVDISQDRLDDYPHQLSGGMRQRVVLAMALVLEPEIIIADEPTTGLDVLTRDRILRDLERYRDEFGISVIFVSHDIADLVETCDRLIVMYGGKIMETGPSRELFAEPTHPYTIALKNALPDIQKDPSEMIEMSVAPPDLRYPPSGCRFVNKCPYAVEECHDSHPPLTETKTAFQSACFRAGEAETLRGRAKEVNWNV